MNPRRLASATRVFTARRCGRFFAGAALVLGPGAGRAASLTPLGDLPGGSFESKATGVSADGKTVVGTSMSTNGVEAFR